MLEDTFDKVSSVDKSALLDQIAAEIVKNNVCPDLASSATQLVFGDGNSNADIVFVGEAPGKNEDLQGKPFVGAAGKFLDEMLDSVRLHREDVYITNIVKYRPPNNRDPLPEEKAEFLPYLHRQLEIIEPKVVITLGRHSLEAFIPNRRISEIHGQPKRVRGQVILPLYHPAAALYNSGLKETLLKDFSQIPSLLIQLN